MNDGTVTHSSASATTTKCPHCGNKSFHGNFGPIDPHGIKYAEICTHCHQPLHGTKS